MQKFAQSIALMPPAKIFTVGLSFSLVTGLYACGKRQNSGINLQNFNIGANVTQIQKITQKIYLFLIGRGFKIFSNQVINKLYLILKKKADKQKK